jgi:hypothetical protein
VVLILALVKPVTARASLNIVNGVYYNRAQAVLGAPAPCAMT